LVSYEIVRRWVNHFDGREPLESEEPMPSLIVSSPIRGYRDMHLGGHNAYAEGPLGSIMDLDEQAQRLRMHVEQLAGKIGERNVFCPALLHATASYIEHEWEQQCYAVERLAYDVSGVRCLNLEITRSGGARDREILLIGAPVLMTMRAAFLPFSNYLASSPASTRH
jgi:hypothetical protein